MYFLCIDVNWYWKKLVHTDSTYYESIVLDSSARRYRKTDNVRLEFFRIDDAPWEIQLNRANINEAEAHHFFTIVAINEDFRNVSFHLQ